MKMEGRKGKEREREKKGEVQEQEGGVERWKMGVPVMAQWKRISLGTMRLWVQSLALLSGLRIWHCHELWCSLQMRLRSGVAMALA